MHDLVIYGAGGLGREVAEIVRRINERHRFWNLLGFLDDGAEAGTFSGGLPILGGRSWQSVPLGWGKGNWAASYEWAETERHRLQFPLKLPWSSGLFALS